MTIRLAFMGASGTGKSTLAEALSTELKLPICPVGSRSVADAMGLKSPYEVDGLGLREKFQVRLLVEKLQWETVHYHNGLVTDRTPLDNVAYTSLHAPTLASDPSFQGRVFNAMRVYTHLVFCPISSWHDVAGDPARVGDATYHSTYEAVLLGFMRSKQMPPTNILWLGRSSVEDRLHDVRRFVSS